MVPLDPGKGEAEEAEDAKDRLRELHRPTQRQAEPSENDVEKDDDQQEDGHALADGEQKPRELWTIASAALSNMPFLMISSSTCTINSIVTSARFEPLWNAVDSSIWPDSREDLRGSYL